MKFESSNARDIYSYPNIANYSTKIGKDKKEG